jgi:deazaflavin-dependent oxidoreductase (nitroreductase family)
MSDWNANIITEFRENGGAVEAFKGATMVLLHTTGAKSGVERVNPLVTQPVDDGRWLIFASKGGAPTNPDWFHNVKAGGPVSIEIGTDRFPVTARVLEGEERERAWTKQKELMPGFADYEQKTDREIPVILLERT